MAVVSGEVVRPYPERPTDGILTFNTEFSQMADPTYDPTRQLDEDEVYASRMIERVIRMGKVIDTESLCIVAGEKVWAIRLDLRVLNDDGNILQCACIAAVCGLLHYRRPEVTVAGTEVTVHSREEKEPIPLALLHIPVCVTFGCFSLDRSAAPQAREELSLVDPSLLEERLCQGEIVVCVNSHKEICALSKDGGVPIDGDTLIHCATLASVIGAEIISKIREKMQ